MKLGNWFELTIERNKTPLPKGVWFRFKFNGRTWQLGKEKP